MKIEIELNDREARSLQELADAQSGGDVKVMAMLLIRKQVCGTTFDQEIWGTEPTKGTA
jgi:hypothetical protein